MTEEPKDMALEDFTDAEQFDKDLKLDPTNLQEAMLQHASLYSYYSAQAIKAKRQAEVQSKKLEMLEAKLTREYRTVLKEENPKTTEAHIRSEVLLDRRYAAAVMREINARTIYDMARSYERAFSQQKDMLVQLARDGSKERSLSGGRDAWLRAHGAGS